MRLLYLSILVCCACLTAQAQQTDTDTLQRSVATAQKKAISFLSKNDRLKSQNLVLIVQYLERAYGIHTSINPNKLLQSLPVYDDEKEQIRFFSKLYGGHANITKKEINAQKGLGQLMAWSINADIYKPDATYSKMIWGYSQAKGRDITHAALCLAWLKEQNMSKYITDVDSLERYQVQELLALAKEEDYSSDTGLEALVGLARLGHSDLIKPEFIARILSAQHKEGSWPLLANEDVSFSEHATLMALWVLLDYYHQGIVKEQWILR